ncbi:hypothetical protein LMG29542_02452 [Paraburkholderia humisilvae]|uniref:DUF676 domain-containing protein n=1 Tax=Paraburkholderia humisilvae TaxID=627669 RepID=A0A6J5DKH1_9BURK|nr:hypothetical protein LMG29542_02452 [Paraburkholderia humisilvae]
MKRRILSIFCWKQPIALAAFAMVLVAAAPLSATSKDLSGWVYPAQNKKIAIVFIHGLTGDAMDTWTLNRVKGQSFFRYVKDSPITGKDVDIFTFTYSSENITTIWRP